MRAQKRAFWITFILSTIFLIGSLFCYIFIESEQTIFDFVKVSLMGIFTGLIISCITAKVFHTNEKHKFFKKLFSKSNSIYFYLQKALVQVEYSLSTYQDKDKSIMFSCIENCKNILYSGFDDNNKEAFYYEELQLLCSRKKKFRKIEKVVINVLDNINAINLLLSDCRSIQNISNDVSKYNNTQKKADYLFLSMLNFKKTLETSINYLNNSMINLQSFYKFDITWERAILLIDNRNKTESAKMKDENWRDIANKINTNMGINSIIEGVGTFLGQDFNALNSINAFGREIEKKVFEVANDRNEQSEKQENDSKSSGKKDKTKEQNNG